MTPNFKLAHGGTSINEGGYSNDSSDKGGETYAGISRRYWPHWEGWETIDKLVVKRQGQVVLSLTSLVEKFYYEAYWVKFRLEEIKYVRLACNMYDFLVNSDRDAIIVLQRILGLKQDGVIGPVTIQTANSFSDQWALNAMYMNARFDHYTAIAIAEESQRKLFKGWITRAARFT